jgi:hypothetical protein
MRRRSDTVTRPDSVARETTVFCVKCDFGVVVDVGGDHAQDRIRGAGRDRDGAAIRVVK